MRTQVFALSLGLTCLLLAPAARAAQLAVDDSDVSQAAGRFQRGVELYREGSYEGALAEFRKAYQLSPSYRVLYNVAQAQYALHDFVGAYKSLMQYTSEGGGAIPPERRVQVEEMSAKLEERIAHLQIVTNVSGADVRVDGVSVGVSPLPGLVPVNVGTRRVTAVKAGVPEAVRVVTVAGKESARVEITLDDAGLAVVPAATATVQPSPVPADRPALLLAPGSTVAVAKSSTPTAPSRAGLAVSLSTTAVLAVGTGVCGYLAYQAQQDLEDQVKIYPNTRARIDDARSKSKTYGYVTDALGVATLISAGVTIYFAATQGDSPTKKPAKPQPSLGVAPTLGGMVVQGRF